MRPCPALLLLLLLLLGLGRATSPAPHAPTTVPGGDGATSVPPGVPSTLPAGLWVVQYPALLAATLELLNARGLSPYLLRLGGAQGQHSQPVDLRQRQELSFTAEETTCRAPGTVSTACSSRWFGSLMRCRGWAFVEQQQPTVELSCHRVPTLLPRGRSSKLRDFFTRVKERFRSFFQCSNIWIRDKLNLPGPQR